MESNASHITIFFLILENKIIFHKTVLSLLTCMDLFIYLFILTCMDLLLLLNGLIFKDFSFNFSNAKYQQIQPM